MLVRPVMEQSAKSAASPIIETEEAIMAELAQARRTAAVQLYEAGYRDLVCVIPPGATLSKKSKIKPALLGKG